MFEASSSSASLAGSSSSSAGSTTTSAPASSPSSPSSVDVHAACTGPRRPRTTISRMPGGDDRLDGRIGGVGGRELLAGQREHARDVECDVPVPDDDCALVREVELEVLEVGVAVVPGDELGRGPRAREVFAGDPEPPVRLRPDRVDDRVVERGELVVADVASDLDVAEEAEAGTRRDLLERTRDGLQLRMVRRDAEPDEPPGRRKPLDHVDLDRRILAREERAGGVERRRARSPRSRLEIGRPSGRQCYG